MNAKNLLIAGGDSAARLVVGQRVLNRYALRSILGEGGMGVVWLARDEVLELDVALKFVSSLVVNDRASLEDLKRETRRNLALTHPHIVRTYDFVHGDSLAGISMEYVDADTLRNRRLDQPSGVFAPEDLGEWTLQLTEALQYAHQTASIVHRDLKPANLLINGRRQLKVADFGISRTLGESVAQMTGRNTSAGTLPYMSPQQIDGDPAHPLDDIYGIGATLYELCTSRPPFFSGELVRQIVLKVPPTMAERRAELAIAAGKLPQNWEGTIAACLAKERSQRPQSAGEVAVRLGLKEAAATRTTSRPLLVVHKVAVKPLKAPGPPTATAPVRRDWESRARVRVQGYGRTAAQTLAAALARVKRDRRTAAVLIVAAVAAGWLHGARRGENSTLREATAARNNAALRESVPSSGQGRAATTTSDPAAGARGGLLVETQPAGALVQVDHQPADKTPVRLKNLTAGPQSLGVSLDGYEDYEAKLDIKAGQTFDAGKIKLVPQSGSFSVNTNPPGADLAVRGPGPDAPEVHYTSPWSSGPLPIGEYEVSATRTGWKPVAQKVSVVKAQSIPVTFDLTGGTVEIDSVPPKATVLVDGKAVGVTPYVMQDVPPGPIKYSLALPGYGQTDVEGAVEAGRTLTLAGNLASVEDPSKAAETAGKETSRSHHGDEAQSRRRHPRNSSKKSGGSNAFLDTLKKLPIPFWRH